MSILGESILSRLGSRFCINFCPGQKRIRTSPLGRFYDVSAELIIGIKIGECVRILPFSTRYESFQTVEQELTPNSITFICNDPELGVNARFRFVSPFIPQDTKVSVAPFFYLESSIEYCGKVVITGDAILTGQGEEQIQGDVLIGLEGAALGERKSLEQGFVRLISCSIDPELAVQKWLYKTKGKQFSSGTYHGEVGFYSREPGLYTNETGYGVPFTARKHDTIFQTHVCAGYTDEQILQVKNDLNRFLYTRYFSSIDEVAEYAFEHRNEILLKSDFFDDNVKMAAWNKSVHSLMSFTMQGFISNTWWVVNDKGEEWYSVWEGNCAYHSTIDVEYNIAPFYLMMWPQLLEMTIAQWSMYEYDDGHMPHDVGKFLSVQGMEYGHQMEVEETCNYILMVYAMYKFKGSREWIKQYYPQLKRLAGYVIKSDTTGNGFPNIGTANTFDDAGAAVQYAKEQSYLAIKAYASLTAVGTVAEDMEDTETRQECTRHMELIAQTLEKEAWLGEHYAVCIAKHAEGIIDVWTGEAIDGEIPGWDASSINTVNGLAYLLMTGTPIPMGTDRMRKDVITSTLNSMTRYACTHSSGDKTGNFWISQNVWKDMIASYLGIDMTQFLVQYWDYEVFANSRGTKGGFVESSTAAGLYAYPRGVDSMAMIYAMGGVTVDAVDKVIGFAPVRLPCTVPLYHLADWSNRKVPVVHFYLNQGKTAVNIENPELLKGYTTRLFGISLDVQSKHDNGAVHAGDSI